MESSTSFSVALLACIYLSLISCPAVSGKCWGKWAIHQCWGGNGKRSEPTYASSDMPAYRRADPSNPLRNLLLRDTERAERLNRLVKMSEDNTRSVTDENDVTDYTDEVVDLADREEQLRRFKKILALKLRRALRANMEDRLI